MKKIRTHLLDLLGANDLLESEDNTKRFRLYKKLMENFFSPLKFQHFQYPNKSAYLLLNRESNNPNLKSDIEIMFKKYFPDTFGNAAI